MLLFVLAIFFAQAALAWHNAESIADSHEHNVECAQCIIEKNSLPIAGDGLVFSYVFYYPYSTADYVNANVFTPVSFSIRAPPLSI